ncbi:MAG: cation diffusion facilitator family transporter [Candidatus Saccharibacteria bacterium]
MRSDKPILISLVLNTLLTIIELVAGTATGSLSLIADGSRNLTDSILLSVSYIAERLSRRKADSLRTWGYGRIKIIASLFNTGIITAVAVGIGYEAITTFGQPKNLQGLTVVAVATLSILVNGGAALLLRKQRGDINVRTAYTGLLYGAISAAGVLVAGLLITVFGWYWIDNVTGVGIAIVLLYSTIALARDAIHILLEGTPSGIDMHAVHERLEGIDDTKSITDVHAWTLEHESYAFSCHIVVDKKDITKIQSIVRTAKAVLENEFGFTHVTIQVDVI